MGIATDPKLFYKSTKHLRELGLEKAIRYLEEVSCSKPLECVAKAVATCLGTSEEVIIGIDPGEMSGIVAVVGTTPIYLWEGPRHRVHEVLEHLAKELKIKSIFIGRHYPLPLSLSDKSIEVVMVPEEKTSKRKIKRMKRHESSADVIATRYSLSKERKRIEAD